LIIDLILVVFFYERRELVQSVVNGGLYIPWTN